MPAPGPEHLEPVAALRQAALGRAILYLRFHPLARLVVGMAGAGLISLGALAAPFREVPLLSWLMVGPLAAASLAGGLVALGVWYLSRPIASTTHDSLVQSATGASTSVDLVRQLERLRDLHVAGALTDDEFTRAKARLLR